MGNSGNKRKKRVAVLMIGAWLTACASVEPNDSLQVQVSDSSGAAVESFVAIVAFEDGSLETLECPAADDADLRVSCTAEGIEMAAPPTQLQLTVKSRGYEFVTLDVRTADLPTENGARQLDVSLPAIDAPQENDDYDTGFSADGLQDFIELASSSDSELGPIHAVKFVMTDVYTNPRVYFINMNSYRIHYDFARDVLGYPFTRRQYDQDTYYDDDRTSMAGTLIYHEVTQTQIAACDSRVKSPVVLSFFPSDTLSPVQAQLAHRLIEERLGFAPLVEGTRRLIYMPSGTTQEEDLFESLPIFSERGSLYMTRVELYGDLTLQILNEGKSCGTLRRLTPEQLLTEVVSFRDILVLTRLPIELPVVGGTITEELQTPLSHVNIAAISRGTPNIALLSAGESPEIAALLDQLVCFTVEDGGYSIEAVSIEEAEAFWASQTKEPLVPTGDILFDTVTVFDDMGFADANRFGVKAANVAELYHLLGEVAPYGFAVPFYYYMQFMDTTIVSLSMCNAARTDCTSEGRSVAVCSDAQTLCAGIAADSPVLGEYVSALLGDSGFASDTKLRDAALDGVRYHMRNATVDPLFAASIDALVEDMFGLQKVRLRSSTNAEDLENFNGAGLYDSVSANGGGVDDLPSQEIRKVWASVWNYRAFEERAFWNVDHELVYMGVLVQQAYPDEQANGVIITGNLADPLSVEGMYVNVQLGEVSVTNPEDGSTPEIFTIVRGTVPGTVQSAVIAWSSLSPEAPILTFAEINRLHAATYQAQRHFGALYGVDPATAWFDLEFKFHGPQRELVIKQIRPFIGAP